MHVFPTSIRNKSKFRGKGDAKSCNYLRVILHDKRKKLSILTVLLDF